ncbi:MAG: HNH/ENDO VII family nuclease [bacterium]
MKKWIAVILILALLASGCGSSFGKPARSLKSDRAEQAGPEGEEKSIFESYTGEGHDLNDETLLRFMEDSVYYDLVRQLDSEEYFVDSVDAAYVSKEYLEDMAYNSRENIYFGYSLREIDQQFQGTKYIFTLDEKGQTTLDAFEAWSDNTFDTAVKNAAIGTGVILVCVTVSMVTASAAPAVSLIFAASARTGAVCALSGGAVSGAAAALVTGIRTGKVEESLKAAALAGSEGYMMCAISGALTGGAARAKGLFDLARGGHLTMDQIALIQKESGYPAEVIRQLRNMDEYDVYKKTAKLSPRMVDNKLALVKDIDLNYVDPDTGLTNLERMKKGLAALDPATGMAYELHHIGQNMDSTLAVLTQAEHDMEGLHVLEESRIDRKAFRVIRQNFWKSMAESAGGG